MSAQGFQQRLRAILDAPYETEIAGALYSLKLEALAAGDPVAVTGAFAEAIGDAASTQTLTFGSLYAYATRNDCIVGVGHPGGRSVIKMPIVRGAETGPDVILDNRPVVAIRLEDAWVTGRSGMIGVGSFLLADYHDDELSAWPVDFRFDPVVFQQLPDAALTLICPEDGPPLDEAISLVGCTSFNFGHWTVEYMYRFFVLKSQGLAEGVPILIDAGLTQTQRGALELYSQGRHPIIEVGALRSRHVRRLWVPTNLCFAPIMPRAGVEFTLNHISPTTSYAAHLRRAMSDAIRPLPDTPKRIYLARSMALQRKLLNQPKIIEVCRAAGFEIFYPEEHDFLYQVSLAYNADVIIGPEGSAMLLTMHARPGARVLILNHPFLENVPTLTYLLEELGIHVEVLPGACIRLGDGHRKFSDYEIAPDDLRRVFANWGLTAADPAPPSAQRSVADSSYGAPARMDEAADHGQSSGARDRPSLMRRLLGMLGRG